MKPICGNCGKLKSEHYHERNEVFCFTDTTGDVFTDEPPEGYIMNQVIEYYPRLYDRIIRQWKIKNGHPVTD